MAVGIAAPAGVAMAAQVIVVIDGSGSSAGQIGGVAKIDIARGALRTILAGGPDNLEIGLVAYGHRVSETCSDIELLAPPGPTDAFLDAAARVQSVGRSPIADATAAAAAALTEDEATIIVITDNSDNCSPDPCATISALKSQMPGLTVSVVGIAIPDNEVAEIACFAELTGGVYLRADSATGFQASLSEAMELAWVDPGPPPPPMPTARLIFPTGVVQGQVFAVEFDGPAAPGDEIRIAWVGTPATSFITGGTVGEDGAPVLLTAPELRGAYELRYWHAERDTILARIPLRLDPLLPAVSAPATAQQGAEIEIAWQAVAHGGETIQIVPVAPLEATPIVTPAIRGEPTAIMTAPGTPGLYDIILVTGPDRGEPPNPGGGVVLARSRIEIVAAEITLRPDAPIAAGRRFAIAWTGPDGAEDEIRIAANGAAPGDFLASVSPAGNSVVDDGAGRAGNL